MTNEPDDDRLDDVQKKIDDARGKARDDGIIADSDHDDERDLKDEEEEVVRGLTRPGLG